MIGDKKEVIKSMYKESYAQYRDGNYDPWDMEAVDIALEWLFHYAEENRHEVMYLTCEQAKHFLIWFHQAAGDPDTRGCVKSTLLHFYDYLVSIEWSKTNPFQRIKEEGGCLMREEEE